MWMMQGEDRRVSRQSRAQHRYDIVTSASFLPVSAFTVEAHFRMKTKMQAARNHETTKRCAQEARVETGNRRV